LTLGGGDKVDNERAASRRSHVLDGLRGFAALAVVFYHTILAPIHNNTSEILYRSISNQTTFYGMSLKIALSILNGEVAVYIFFTISGIVLYNALEGMDHRADSPLQLSWHFLARRFLRIWPVMAACLLTKFLLFHQINMIWPNTISAPSPSDLIINLWLIRFPVHGATWTLFVELAAAPVFLIAFFSMKLIGRWALTLLILYSLLAILKFHFLLFNSHELLGGVPFILVGVAVAGGQFNALLYTSLRQPLCWLALIALFANVLFVSAYADFTTHYLGLLCSIGFLVAWVYTAKDNVVCRFLEAPVSQLLGRLSYSLYLWNVPIFELLFLAVDPGLASARPLEIGLLVGCAAIFLSIPIAHYSERWLEQPCIAVGRRLTGSRAPKAIAAPASI
jgi:peptidoglycan/LPS O-acetylase OafA/YrhL